MSPPEAPDYAEWSLVSDREWDGFAADVLVPLWVVRYVGATAWEPEIVEIDQNALTFMFDAAPTLGDFDDLAVSDRVVAVWGRSAKPTGKRDPRRLAGFLSDTTLWSGRNRDRGHLIAHSAGGGLDMNLIPQASALSRGRSPAGRRWRKLERHAASHPGTPLFVCPIYDGPSWVPASLEYGLVVSGRLRVERFANR